MTIRMWVRDIGLLATGSAVASAAAWIWRTRRDDRRLPILGGWPKVIVVGAGFGGLRVARGLAGVEADVLVIDRHNYHCFQPLLYQVATAGLEPEEIAYPVRRILRDIPNVRFRMTTVTGLDLEHRQLLTDVGAVPYDYLVLATGSVTNYFGHDELKERALSLKDLNGAVSLRNHLLDCFEQAIGEKDLQRRAALLTFVVVGGGPTGVEFAGALAELIRLVLAHDYAGLDVKDARVVLAEAGPNLLAPVAGDLQKAALRALHQKGVEIRLASPVESFDGKTVVLSNGEALATETFVWTAGVRPSGLAAEMGLPLVRGGRVNVSPTLQVEGMDNVYAIGDLAGLEGADGRVLPMLAPVAVQQGELVAQNVQRQIEGRPLLRFTYHDKGTMATIGRNAAVCQIGNLHLTGFPAWVAWLVVHLLQLISFRNRMLVLINWIWDYLFFDRAVRLITRD